MRYLKRLIDDGPDCTAACSVNTADTGARVLFLRHDLHGRGVEGPTAAPAREQRDRHQGIDYTAPLV